MTEDKKSLVDDFLQSITPNYVFGEQSSPSTPDYSLEENWAALPKINSKAELTPSSLEMRELVLLLNLF